MTAFFINKTVVCEPTVLIARQDKMNYASAEIYEHCVSKTISSIWRLKDQYLITSLLIFKLVNM